MNDLKINLTVESAEIEFLVVFDYHEEDKKYGIHQLALCEESKPNRDVSWMLDYIEDDVIEQLENVRKEIAEEKART